MKGGTRSASFFLNKSLVYALLLKFETHRTRIVVINWIFINKLGLEKLYIENVKTRENV